MCINYYFQAANFEAFYFTMRWSITLRSRIQNQKPNFDDFLLQDPDSLSKTAFGFTVFT